MSGWFSMISSRPLIIGDGHFEIVSFTDYRVIRALNRQSYHDKHWGDRLHRHRQGFRYRKTGFVSGEFHDPGQRDLRPDREERRRQDDADQDISTLLEPTSGKATIDGLDVMADAKTLRERMAVVPQEGRAVQWMTPVQSVSSYLLWRGISYRESRAKALDALARVGLGEVTDRLNRTLSGGMKRKVLAAMVIASVASSSSLTNRAPDWTRSPGRSSGT